MTMTTTERAALVLQQIDAALALAEKATPGPWRVTGCDKHTNKDTAYIKVRGTRLGAKWQIADVRFIEAENFTEQKEAQQLAAFIAAARTLLPVSLEIIRDDIKTWLEIMQVVGTSTEAWHKANNRLTALCDQWEAGR